MKESCCTPKTQCACGQTQDPQGLCDGSHLQVNT
jgi:hypothetical protein